MSEHNFENLDVWKRGVRLAIDVCVAFYHTKDFALKGQITRSAISIPSNIAEGAERSTDSDFCRFLDYSKGSCGELRTQLLIHEGTCEQLKINSLGKTADMIQETKEISKMLGALIAKLRPAPRS